MKRDLEYMRERLNAPLIYDRDREGYRYDLSVTGADRYDLPGVWFSPAEIHALLVIHALLSGISPGLFEGTVAPLIARIEKLLESHRLPSAEVRRRVRVFNVAYRNSLPETFGMAAQAVLQRQRLQIEHYHRRENRNTAREISPQRLIHYRGTWYLDGWCHLRKGLRSFSLDAIERMSLAEGAIHEVSDAELETFFASGYGIFSGVASQKAILRFAPERARWVQHERWHPDQVGTLEEGGSYRLEFPFGNDTELVMDVLRHGAEVEVIAPPSLRERVAEEGRRLMALYGTPVSHPC